MKNKIWLIITLFFTLSFVVSDDNRISITLYQKIKTFNLASNETSLFKDLILPKKVNVLIFHSINCPFNKANQPKISYLKEKYLSDSVNFMYVNSNPFEYQAKQTNNDLLSFINKCQCAYLLDYNSPLKHLFKVTKNGTVLVIKQKEGVGIDVFYEGPIDDNPQSEKSTNNFLDQAIQNALLDSVSHFNTIETGCRILNH